MNVEVGSKVLNPWYAKQQHACEQEEEEELQHLHAKP
jgi:hypothetical protein